MSEETKWVIDIVHPYQSKKSKNIEYTFPLMMGNEIMRWCIRRVVGTTWPEQDLLKKGQYAKQVYYDSLEDAMNYVEQLKARHRLI